MKGVLQDYEEAVKWYTKAAEQGHEMAQLKLGNVYRDGKGVLQDYEEAVKWYTKAAEQGSDLAQFNLGAIHAHTAGVSRIIRKRLSGTPKRRSKVISEHKLT